GDFNGDDLPDIVVARAAGLTMLPNTCAAVNSTNTVPVARSQTRSVMQGTLTAITLVALAADQGILTYNVTSPTHGTLSGTPPNVLYQPALHYYGSDAFAFAVNDGKTDSARATVSLKVLAADHTPVTDRCPAPNFVAIRQIDLITGLHSIAVDDFNGDGVPDLAAANDGPAPGHTVGRVWILLGR